MTDSAQIRRSPKLRRIFLSLCQVPLERGVDIGAESVVDVHDNDPRRYVRATDGERELLADEATWVTFRREFAMTRSDIADAAAWAAEAVLDPIRSRVG